MNGRVEAIDHPEDGDLTIQDPENWKRAFVDTTDAVSLENYR